MSFFSILPPLSLLLLVATAPFASAECKACLFDGNDPSDCVIYGKLGDQVVEWSTANIECKGYYGIAISSINPVTSCRSATAFVQSLRFGDLETSDSKLGLGVASEGGSFFEQANGRIEMVDSIVINGETSNCEASAQTCWAAMTGYFEDGEGAKEMEQVCDTLRNKVRLDKNLEESVLRNRLCMERVEGTPIITSCDPLAQQVKDEIAANPDRDCSAYGFEVPLSTVPGCETVLESTTSSGSSGGTTTATPSGSKQMTMAGLVSVVALTSVMVGLV